MNHSLLLLLFVFNLAFSQILPTIPANVFRVTFSNDIKGDYKMNFAGLNGKQNFNLSGIGRHYFNNLQHNDSVRFSSNYDLYHNGTVLFDPNLEDAIPGSLSVENWMNKFNLEQNLFLPVFGNNNFDTSLTVDLKGSFYQNQEKISTYQSLNFEYGMSNEVTLKVNVPIVREYIISNSIDSAIVGRIENIGNLIGYHINSKNELDEYFNSNEFSNLSRKKRDSLTTIYDLFYSDEGEYSVTWVFHSQDDPVNNKLIDQRFFPITENKDSLNLDSLIAYFYPDKKYGTSKDRTIIDDIIIGATILLKGKPNWHQNKTENVLYGQLLVSIPFGPTLSSFKNDLKQFKEAKVGSGVTRFSLGLLGSKKLKKTDRIRVFFKSLFKTSSPELLNTPIALFSGSHSHPDSISSSIGNTYKYDMGSEIQLNLGGEIEIKKNKLLSKSSFNARFKAKDDFTSKSISWDKWMSDHLGYTSSYGYIELDLQFWFINSFSKTKTKFIPSSFDAFIGLNKTIYSKNTFEGLNIYTGFTTYLQGW